LTLIAGDVFTLLSRRPLGDGPRLVRDEADQPDGAVAHAQALERGGALAKASAIQCYLRAALTANCGKRLRSCAADCDRPKWVKVQIAVLACSASIEPPERQAPPGIILQNSQATHLALPP
jgi:hypothetical protein